MTLPSPPHPTLTLIILLRALLSSSIGYDPCGPNDTVVFTVTINQRCHLTISNRFPHLPSPTVNYHTVSFSRIPMDPVENVPPAPNQILILRGAKILLILRGAQILLILRRSQILLILRGVQL